MFAATLRNGSLAEEYVRAAMAGVSQSDLYAVELDAQTGYHAAAYGRSLDGLSIAPV